MIFVLEKDTSSIAPGTTPLDKMETVAATVAVDGGISQGPRVPKTRSRENPLPKAILFV